MRVRWLERMEAAPPAVRAKAPVSVKVLLRRGHYRLASNLTIIAGLASLAALGFADSIGGPMLRFTRLAFLLTPAIV